MRTLDPTDCDRVFHGGVWSERNHPIRRNGGEPLLSAGDLYGGCLGAARQLEAAAEKHRLSIEEGHHATSTDAGDVWFNVEIQDQLYNRQKEPTRPEQMPLPDDGGLLGYAERMSRTLGGKNFCLRVTDIHSFDVGLFRKLCRYLAPLTSQLRDDPVPRQARTILFVGDYAYTPFGSHMDPDPQFQYLAHGRRTAHVWTPECWKREPRKSLEAWRYFDEAETFNLDAGDAIYWPAGHFHVFESHGLSMAVTFAFPEVEAPGNAEEREALRSKHGFHNCPPPIDPPPLKPSDTLLGQPDLPIVLLPAAPDAKQRVVACNGHLLRLPALIDFAPIVARINGGEPFACGQVMAEVRAQMPAAAGEQADHAAIEILRAFVATHALDRV